ncbi:MAG: hypothetical protein F6J86_26895 [Symploca sp. SIO1B1]|nr:hypothetical protein [Symploca sp. SIO1B1]
MRIEKIRNLLELSNHPHQRVTSRMLDWLKNEIKEDSDPTKAKDLYPVSCTVLAVADSIHGDPDSICEMGTFIKRGTKGGCGITLEMSSLRPAGSPVSGTEAYASGPNSFLESASADIGTIRRHGVYKNGAGCAYINHDHPDLLEWLGYSNSYGVSIQDRLGDRFNIPPVDFDGNANQRWIKKAIYVDDTLLDNPLLPEIMQSISRGRLFVAKKQWSADGERLYSNICTEALLPNRGTCSINHVNLANITDIGDIVPAMEMAVMIGCEVRSLTVLPEDLYMAPYEDCQIMVGVIGLANLLGRFGISYEQFVGDLTAELDRLEEMGTSQYLESRMVAELSSRTLVSELVASYHMGGGIAKSYGISRAFTVAPTINSAFREPDIDGMAIAPEIAPPVFNPKTFSVERRSGTNGTSVFQYPDYIENAVDVGFETYFNLANQWQRLMNSTALSHAISFNTWESQPIDESFIRRFMASNLKSLYYRINPDQSTVDKSSIGVEGVSAESLLGDLATGGNLESQSTAAEALANLAAITANAQPKATASSAAPPLAKAAKPSESTGKAIGSAGDDPGYCQVCGG